MRRESHPLRRAGGGVWPRRVQRQVARGHEPERRRNAACARHAGRRREAARQLLQALECRVVREPTGSSGNSGGHGEHHVLSELLELEQQLPELPRIRSRARPTPTAAVTAAGRQLFAFIIEGEVDRVASNFLDEPGRVATRTSERRSRKTRDQAFAEFLRGLSLGYSGDVLRFGWRS